jgi:hypothetical protein
MHAATNTNINKITSKKARGCSLDTLNRGVCFLLNSPRNEIGKTAGDLHLRLGNVDSAGFGFCIV